MNENSNQVAKTIGRAASRELTNALKKIRHCLNQLSDEQVWWRHHNSMNSIGNLLLHLRGNLRQWIIAGIGGEADNRNRPEEFSARKPISKSELFDDLEFTVSECNSILDSLLAANLVGMRVIQGFETNGAQAIFDAVAHFRGHVQEIVYITRCTIGDEYRFDFVPRTPEEGAPRLD